MERRTFLTRAINVIGAGFGALLSIPIIAYLLDPLNRSARAGDFREVARLGDLEPGVPKEAVVRNVRRDAWNLHPNDIVGRVWLIRRKAEAGEETVDAFTTICPHLGCSINFQERSGQFVCPCHNGVFTIEGTRIPDSDLGRPNPPPRGMDHLECKIIGGVIEVKYENFIKGLHDRVVKS